jgi:hypothetical protein
MNKYWFKPKRYGYGFYPITWEGWLFTLVLLLLVFVSAYLNNFVIEATTHDGLRFLLDVILITGVFTCLFKDKVKSGLRWQWGNKNK